MEITESQYKTIINTFDEINAEHNMGLLNHNVVEILQRSLNKKIGGAFNWIDDWDKIIAIASPLTRRWAHDKFVDKNEIVSEGTSDISDNKTAIELNLVDLYTPMKAAQNCLSYYDYTLAHANDEEDKLKSDFVKNLNSVGIYIEKEQLF